MVKLLSILASIKFGDRSCIRTWQILLCESLRGDLVSILCSAARTGDKPFEFDGWLENVENSKLGLGLL